MRTLITVLAIAASLVGCDHTAPCDAPASSADYCADMALAVEHRIDDLHCAGSVWYVCPEDSTYGYPLTRGCAIAVADDTTCAELQDTLTSCGAFSHP